MLTACHDRSILRWSGAPNGPCGRGLRGEGGQGRPQVARRGSLEGPVSGAGTMWLRSRSGLRWERLPWGAFPLLGVGVALRSVLQVKAALLAGRAGVPGRRSSIRHGRGGMEGFGRSQTGSIRDSDHASGWGS